MQVQYPLRERRKQRTRAALIDAAIGLFSTKGYDDTTLEEVADHAGLHVQTLYRHFPSKPELAIAVDRRQIEAFREAIEDPERDSTTFQFWREQIVRNTTQLQSEAGGLSNFRALLREQHRSPSIALRLHTLNDEYENLLTASLAGDFGVDPESDRLPRLVACMLVAGNRHVANRWAEDGAFGLADEAVAVANQVESLFEHHVVRSADSGEIRSSAANG